MATRSVTKALTVIMDDPCAVCSLEASSSVFGIEAWEALRDGRRRGREREEEENRGRR